MAVDTQKLFYLLDPVFQIENLAGKPVVGGHIEVFVAGTDTKYITWQDWGGARNPFKIPLKSDGRAVILVEPQYTYDVYVYDSFNNMVCSRLNVSPAIGGDVSVSGLTQVFHDETISGNGTPQEPIGVVSAGKVYQGIDPIVVNNTEDKISANHVPLGVQDPLYFVQDDEEGCIIGFSGQTVPEGVMTESALGFENDKITGYNGSAFSAGNEYEEGSYVSIDNNIISVTGLQPEGDYAYNSALNSKLDVTATGQFLTGLPEDLVYTADITGLATTAQLDEKLDKSDSGNFYPMEGNPSGFLTAHQSLDDYATKQWVEDKGYLTGVDIPESATWNATTQTVSANSAQWAGGTANPQIPVTGINGIKISESGDKVVFEVSGDYYTNDNPSGFITGVDLSDYATTTQLAEKQDITGMTAYQPVGNYQTAGDYLTTADSANFYTTANESGFITGVDLTPYQTTAEMTAYQPVGDYLTTADSANFYTTANESGFITGVDLTPYQLTADMTAYQSAGDYLTTADSANFYTTANESGFISAVPDTYLQNTDLSTEDGKVTAISGIPLSAGGDVPEGVMVESAVGYNAVQEISGYNGSAIAQYGAEKQWLQHDDTIVHVSNSAQYAFGCNISALQRLMGIDETVLFDGENTTGAELSEDPKNFNYLRIDYGARKSGTTNVNVLSINVPAGAPNYAFSHLFKSSPNSTATNDVYKSYSYYSGCDTTAWNKVYGRISQTPFTALADNKSWTYIYKIVGIGRRS